MKNIVFLLTLILLSACTNRMNPDSDCRESLYDKLGKPISINVGNGSIWFKWYVTVLPGDTIKTMAERYNTTEENIMSVNKGEKIEEGKTVLLWCPKGYYQKK